MSRKTISFAIPQKKDAAVVGPLVSPKTESRADHWVRQEEKPAVPGALTITISPEPDWCEAMRIGLFLPHIALWFWTLNAAKRNLRMFLAYSFPERNALDKP